MPSRIILNLAAAALSLPALAVVADDGVLRAARVSNDDISGLLAPQAEFWKRSVLVEVPLLPQIVTNPTNPNPSVKSVRVRAVHNGSWLALLVEWNDATRNDRVGIDQFGDQMAVQLPVKYIKNALQSPMMGNPGGRVDIWQWRAAFQRDLDAAEQHAQGGHAHATAQLRERYPNAVVDLYPDEVLQATDARPYTGALGLDNPVSHPKRSPVLDQAAEGWGTMTVEPSQDAEGRGVWRDGVWRVVVAHAMSGTDPHGDHDLRAGDETVVAFAVWDGGKREVGSRKAWSNWVPLRLQE